MLITPRPLKHRAEISRIRLGQSINCLLFMKVSVRQSILQALNVTHWQLRLAVHAVVRQKS